MNLFRIFFNLKIVSLIVELVMKKKSTGGLRLLDSLCPKKVFWFNQSYDKTKKSSSLLLGNLLFTAWAS